MNNKVTVTGMEVKTKVSNNLFVASTTLAATDPVADANFHSYLNYTADAALLQPVSSIDGLNFFYTDSANNVAANGSAIAATYSALNTAKAAPSNDQLTAFRAANGADDSVGYTDYVMELKAVNGESSAVALKLTKLDLIYNGLPTSEKAWRVAVFVEKYNESDYTVVSEATLPAATSIFSKTSATNFTANKAVNGDSTLDTVLTPNAPVNLSVSANKTEYFKVVVRIWLEGEDNTCNNTTFASLDQKWALDLAFELDTETAAAANLGTSAVAATAAGAVGTVTLTETLLSNGEKPASYAWYNAATGAAVDGATSSTYTATATGVYYCKITTAKGNVYYTEGMTLTVA